MNKPFTPKQTCRFFVLFYALFSAFFIYSYMVNVPISGSFLLTLPTIQIIRAYQTAEEKRTLSFKPSLPCLPWPWLIPWAFGLDMSNHISSSFLLDLLWLFFIGFISKRRNHMNIDKPKLILTLFVLSYTAICGLYIHSYLTGDNPPLFILLFTILPILNSDWQTTRPEANAVQEAIHLYRKPLLWFLIAGFALTFSIGFFTGQIKPLLAGFWGMLAILLFKQSKK